MLVKLFNKHCSRCGVVVPQELIDIPLAEIKLSPFPVECPCGYFYEALHDKVFFTHWLASVKRIEFNIKDYQGDIKKLEKSILEEAEEYGIDVLNKILGETKVKLDKAQAELTELKAKPEPNN